MVFHPYGKHNDWLISFKDIQFYLNQKHDNLKAHINSNTAYICNIP